MNTENSVSQERLIGRVKWFNNKAGYGFITVTDGPKSGADIFTHHSSIMVVSEQYKYLVQGEYVEFELSTVNTDGHEFQAVNVSGIKGGLLMCETRKDLRSQRYTYNTENKVTDETVAMPRSVRAPRTQGDKGKETGRTYIHHARGQGPRANMEQGEWSYVSKPKKTFSEKKDRHVESNRQT